MTIARLASGPRRRPALLALVFGFVLVLIGVTASALVAVASAHLQSTTLSGTVARDATLVELFVNANLIGSDVDADGPGRARAAELGTMLASLTAEDGILRIELRAPDGRVLASDDPAVVGRSGAVTGAIRSALDGRATADIVNEGGTVEAVDGLPATSVVQEYLPVIDGNGAPIAVVGLWRDAAPVIAAVDAARRDVMLVTLAAGLLLAFMVFLMFRSAQARLTRQQAQLVEATRRDALTEMLNHGTVVALLADELESARAAHREIGVALVDIDGFRLFNDTHGHEAGDEVLLHVAEIVADEPDEAHVARYGPDEFLIIRPGADLDEMQGTAERLRAGLEDLTVQFGESERLPVTVSIGLCLYPDHGASVTDLLTAAAIAVGEARASGGNSVRVADADDDDATAGSGSFDVLQGLVIAVDTKDRYTKRHSEDVARYAVFLARRMGIDEETRRTIQMAGLLHDVGKIGIPAGILRKPSKLTAEEYGIFQQHVALGEAIVRDVPNVDVVRAGIRHHHERWDGGGYLEGLEGEEIPIVGRILAVADAFSAMTTTRPYRKALPIEEALKRLGDAAGTQLQEELVVAFIEGIETAPDAPLPGEEPTSIWRPELWVA